MTTTKLLFCSVSLKQEECSEEVEDIGVDYENLRPTYTHEALKILLDMVTYFLYIVEIKLVEVFTSSVR